ncbi:MAG: glycosyltransferase [Cytophagaceae bacterium]|nr:glycosyltransferase [Cytophagaceae bacterium]
MEFDLYQLGIAFTRFRFKVSGIWFRPYHRMQPENNSFKSKLNYLKHIIQKKITFLPTLLNSRLSKVFVLNDENVKSFYGIFSKKIFYLPDPVFIYQKEESFDLRKKYGIPPNNMILLQFGHMEERKNNENIIKALDKIPSEISKNITLLLIGKFISGYEQKVKSLVTESSVFQLITHNQFISDEEMEATFAQADVILRMNLNFLVRAEWLGLRRLTKNLSLFPIME